MQMLWQILYEMLYSLWTALASSRAGTQRSNQLPALSSVPSATESNAALV